MGKTRKLGLVLLCFILISTSTVSACTIFTASQGETVMFAGNEDQQPNEMYLLVDTAGTYGVVYFATPWQQWSLIPMMGINDAGLCYDTNWIPQENLNPHPERQTAEEWAVIDLMGHSTTVEEVLEKAFTYNWGDSISYQVHFADATGDAAVIHPGPDGELTYTRKNTGDGYLVSTNFNLKRLRTGDYSCDRYETATEMLQEIGAQQELTAEYMASILDATHAEGQVSTIYSAVYDLPERLIYLYIHHRFNEPLTLDVYEQLAEGDKQVPIEDLFPDVSTNSSMLERMAPVVFLALVMLALFINHRRRT